MFYGSVPFAHSVRQQPLDRSQFGLGVLFTRLGAAQPNPRITRDVPQAAVMTQGPTASRPAQVLANPANPF